MTKSSGGRSWQRLGLFVVGPAGQSELLKRRANALRRAAGPNGESDTPNLDILNAAEILTRLANSPKALQALYSPGRGRRPISRALDMAMDALASRELEGPGKTAAADFQVAKAWRVKEGTIKDALTDWGTSARYQLSQLVEKRVGTFRRQFRDLPPELWTRDDLLRAVSLDIRDHNECSERKAVRRTKRNKPNSKSVEK